jgi:uncharacterized membrane protein
MLKIFLILIIIDLIYLKIYGYPLYSKLVKNITNEDIKFNYLGIVAYILISYGLYYFIIKENKNYKDAFLLGLIIYGTFDFTNIAIFSKYDVKIAILDTIYGGILLALTTYIYKLIN